MEGSERRMADKTLVLTVFPDDATARAAAAEANEWARGLDITFEAMGILVLDHQGHVKTEKIGAHSSGKGASIGLVLAMATPVGLAAGVIGGGLLGRLHHKGLGLSNEDRDALGAQLLDGRTALGVLTDPTGAEAFVVKMQDLGGTSQVHQISGEDVAEVDAAA